MGISKEKEERYRKQIGGLKEQIDSMDNIIKGGTGLATSADIVLKKVTEQRDSLLK